MDAALSMIDGNDTGFLFDRADFKAELAKLDLGPDPTDEATTSARRRTLAEWAQEEGLELSPLDQSVELESHAARPTSARAINIVAFVGLMLVGAAAAAAVFSEQLLRILSSF